MNTDSYQEKKKRIATRLERLRKDVPVAWKESQVNKDHTALTTDFPGTRAQRTYFLGEVCWVKRNALPFQKSRINQSDHGPAVVTRKSHPPGLVEMAPGSLVPPDYIEELCFSPAERINGLPKGVCFFLPWRKPVERHRVEDHFATLSHSDKQRLGRELDYQKLGETK